MDPAIHIGQHADSIQNIIGKEIQVHYNANGWLVRLSAQTVDYKGAAREIIFHKENVLISPIEKGIEVYIHFIMANDTLSCITTQYVNLSLLELKKLMIMSRRTNMNNYFFAPDCTNYHHIYIAGDGLATDDFRKTKKEQLPLSVLEQLHMIANKW